MAENLRHVTTDRNVAYLQKFEKEILIVCEHCGNCAAIHEIHTVDGIPHTRVGQASCSHCGKIWEQPYSYLSYRSLPLWLTTTYRGHRLWAFNERHPDWLGKFIGAELREDKFGGSMALHSVLPRWMTSAKNRAGVMKGLARLRNKLTK